MHIIMYIQFIWSAEIGICVNNSTHADCSDIWSYTIMVGVLYAIILLVAMAMLKGALGSYILQTSFMSYEA